MRIRWVASVAPTHTTGALTTSDGITWVWYDAAAVIDPLPLTPVITTGIAAAGATQLSYGLQTVSTIASGAGVKLPMRQPGQPIVVPNKGTNALLVYPATGHTIQSLAANAAISVAAGTTLRLTGETTTTWV